MLALDTQFKGQDHILQHHDCRCGDQNHIFRHQDCKKWYETPRP